MRPCKAGRRGGGCLCDVGLRALPLGPGALAGLFELWLCGAGAKLIGSDRLGGRLVAAAGIHT